MHTLTSYDGVVFSSISWEAEFPDEGLRGTWDVAKRVTPRSGNTSVIGPGAISPRRVVVDFVYTGSGDVRNAIDELLGALDPTDQNPRTLVGARYDATAVQREATVELPSGFDGQGNVNVIRAVFISESPEWTKTTATTATQSGSVSPFSLSHTNQGKAVVRPRYRLGWTALASQSDAFPSDVADWVEELNHASATVGWSWDNVTYRTAVGAATANTTANTVTGAVISNFVKQTRIACRPGVVVRTSAWARTTHASLQPYLTVAFYTSGGAYISGSDMAVGALAINTWTEIAFTSSAAPPTAAFCALALNVYSVASGATGFVTFDDTALQVLRPPGTIVGQTLRKRMTLTNTQARTLGPFPYRIDLGSTAALVSGSKLQADGDDLRLLIDGRDMTRYLVGVNLAQSFAWIVIPGMDAGEVLTIDLVYGNASATNPPVWTDPDPTKPVIDLNWETGTATGGSTTTLVKAGAGWDTNEWRRAYLYMLTGTLAGEFHTVNSNTATTLDTVTFSATIDAGDTFLVVASASNRWSYAVRQTDRDSDYARGRFYADRTGSRPSETGYDAPGSWGPNLVADNRDSMGQASYSFLSNGTDTDTYTLLDVARMWEGNDARVPNAGEADGLSLVVPMPLSSLYWEYQLDNPNAMVQAFIGVRGSGSEDWAEAFSDDAVTSGLTTRSSGVDPLANVASNFGDVWQLVTALLPVNGIEIDPDWRRDTGSLTSGTITTSTDSSKEWATDQFDNGSILMTSGANQGIKRGITSGTATAQTHAAFPTANKDGDRYVVQNKRLKGILRDGSTLVVEMDADAITDSGLGSETAVYELAATIWVGAGPSGDPAGQHRALIGYATNGTVTAGDERRVFLAADEQLEIDAELRRVRIWNTTSETYTSELADPAVIWQWHNGTDWQRDASPLVFGTGAQLVWVEETNIGTLALEVHYFPAYLGA